MSLHIGRVDSTEKREALYRFRYQVYVEEFGMTTAADHDNRRLTDALDEISTSYVILDSDNAIRGSLRTTYLVDVPDQKDLAARFWMQPAIERFGASAIATTSRFILDPALRNGRIILRIMEAAYADFQRHGCRLNYGDCSAHLLPFYEHMGYRRYTNGYNDTAYGYKVPILMLLGDRSGFDRIRSPLRRIARQTPDDAEAREWFAQTYPGYVTPPSASLMADDLFFDLLGERVGSDPLHAVALLQGLDRCEAKQFLQEATIVKLKPGDRLIHAGQVDQTLFVLLAGIAEVCAPDGNGPALAVLGAGDTFGEIAFLTAVPRSADVIARSDGEVLVLSSEFMQRFITTRPELAARILLNLAKELAGRLAWTTDRLNTSSVC